MVVDYLAWADRNWGLLTRLMSGHARLYRATGGIVGQHIPGLPEMCLLDHVGARTSIKRTTPLVLARETRRTEPFGSNILLIASKGGYPKNPAWYHNLKANPDTTVQIGPKLISVRAREASAEEYDRLWALAVEVYPGYEAYRRRTQRKIPLMVLEPR